MTTESTCVYCRRRPAEPAWRPFCSERCQLLDLQDWVDERYRIPGKRESSLPSEADDAEDGGRSR